MASITFAAGTVIPSTWLNDVNALVYGSSSPPTNPIRVNTNGAVGIGITPNSGWLSARKPIQAGNFLAFWEQSNGASNVGFGLYEGGTNTFSYMTTGDPPSLYSQINGQHIWYNAVSGTANGAVSLIQVLQVDASGNTLIRPQTSAPTLVNNREMVFNLTSDTNLRISVRGSDGVTRTANITLA